MGVHISQVRSTTLDTWLPTQVEFIRGMGNTKANAYYEAKLNEGGASFNRPDSNDKAKLEKFIRDKYEKKRWAGIRVEKKPEEAPQASAAPVAAPAVAPAPDLFAAQPPAPAPASDPFAAAPAPGPVPAAADALGAAFAAPTASSAAAAPGGATDLMADPFDTASAFGSTTAMEEPTAAKKVDSIMNLFDTPSGGMAAGGIGGSVGMSQPSQMPNAMYGAGSAANMMNPQMPHGPGTNVFQQQPMQPTMQYGAAAVGGMNFAGGQMPNAGMGGSHQFQNYQQQQSQMMPQMGTMPQIGMQPQMGTMPQMGMQPQMGMSNSMPQMSMGMGTQGMAQSSAASAMPNSSSTTSLGSNTQTGSGSKANDVFASLSIF